jgi:hypothetical protein
MEGIGTMTWWSASTVVKENGSCCQGGAHRRAVDHAGERKKKIFFSSVGPAWQPRSERVSGLGSRWAVKLGRLDWAAAPCHCLSFLSITLSFHFMFAGLNILIEFKFILEGLSWKLLLKMSHR